MPPSDAPFRKPPNGFLGAVRGRTGCHAVRFFARAGRSGNITVKHFWSVVYMGSMLLSTRTVRSGERRSPAPRTEAAHGTGTTSSKSDWRHRVERGEDDREHTRAEQAHGPARVQQPRPADQGNRGRMTAGGGSGRNGAEPLTGAEMTCSRTRETVGLQFHPLAEEIR